MGALSEEGLSVDGIVGFLIIRRERRRTRSQCDLLSLNHIVEYWVPQ